MDKFKRFGEQVKDFNEHDDPRGWEKINKMLNPTKKTISSRKKPANAPSTRKMTSKKLTMVDKLKSDLDSL